jgi:hypothetical protein
MDNGTHTRATEPEPAPAVLAEIVASGHLRIVARGYARIGMAEEAAHADALLRRANRALRALDTLPGRFSVFPDNTTPAGRMFRAAHQDTLPGQGDATKEDPAS